MGFASFWASITAPRVKEISPSSADFWPERGRPTTASAAIAAGKDTDAGQHDLARSKKRGRFARSFSRPRRAQRERARSKPPERTHDPERDAEKDLPSVPPVPSPALDLGNGEMSPDDETPEDIGRPGTAITTEGLQALSIFELAAEPPTPEETQKTQDDPLPRRRSKSAGAESRPSLSKKASWFRIGSSNKGNNFTPPPPPTCPLPPVPPPNAQANQSIPEPPRAASVESQRATLHDDESIPQRPSSSSTAAKSILDEDSLLDYFPLPKLVHDIDETPDSSVADSSEAGSLHQSTSPARERESVTLRYKKIPPPISTTSAYGHKHKDSAIGTPRSPHTPTGIKRWTRQASSFEDETVQLPNLLDISLEEWGEHPTSCPAPDGPSNDQALAALEFGVLK